MKLNYINPTRQAWIQLMLCVGIVISPLGVRAQEGSQGNTTIFGGAQMTFFGNHDFLAGGGGTQPGVILTERAAGNFGVLNFAGDNLTSTGASDAGYVDGYVRKYGSGQFIFPVGDNGFLGQFAASADRTMGAYFHADPNTAVTNSLFTSSDYPALPAGGPFPTISVGPDVDWISTIEYWDIDGTNPTPLTLTWDAGSDIGELTRNHLDSLVIVGWDGTKWQMIPSQFDPISVLGGNSNFTAGSITTLSPLAPDTYIAYTFGARSGLPVTLTAFTAQKESATARLLWSTTEETNSDRFEIERSSNGNTWKTIGSVKSTGESKVLVEYQFVDAEPASGANLYRLKMIDLDDTFAYSRIRSLDFKGLKQVSVYPNPVANKFFVKDFDKASSIRIVDMQGKSVYQSSIPGRGEVNVSKLVAGMHIVEITWLDGNRTAEKILIQK